jgi:RHS repeat-associated protein
MTNLLRHHAPDRSGILQRKLRLTKQLCRYSGKREKAHNNKKLKDNTEDQISQQDIKFDPVNLNAPTNLIQASIRYPKYNYKGALGHEVININRNFGNYTENLEEFNYFYTYDGMNRLVAVDVAKHDVSYKKQITRYVYNDVNNAVKYETSEAQLIEYDYDVRDRLLNKKSWLMDYRLFYDGNMSQADWTGHTVVSSNNYNGNINGMQINYKFDPASNQSITNFELPTIYGYQYDKLNRLKQADAIIGDFVHAAGYSQESFLIGDENYSYDRIGNLKTLSRHNRATSGTTFAQIESFVYSYQTATNRLASVLGQAGTPSRAYTYDKNGNLLTDNSKQISQTIYERANYPYQITKGTEQYSYLYDANDQRIYKKTVNGTLITEEYYLKDAMGRDIALWKAPNNGNYNWVYQIHGTKLEARIDKRLRPLIGDDVGDGPDIQSNDLLYFHYDHLGNTRITYRKNQDDFSIEYAADYMPYGKIVREFRNGGNIEKYLLTGKERDQETGYDKYDHRSYDSDIARWISPDVLHAKAPGWTPYRFNFDNPIMFVDPTGMLEDDYGLSKDGNVSLIRKTKDKTDKLIALDNNGYETVNSIEVEKGIFNNIKKDKDSYGTKYNI